MSNDGEKGSGYWVLDHLPDLHLTVTSPGILDFGLGLWASCGQDYSQLDHFFDNVLLEHDELPHVLPLTVHCPPGMTDTLWHSRPNSLSPLMIWPALGLWTGTWPWACQFWICKMSR